MHLKVMLEWTLVDLKNWFIFYAQFLQKHLSVNLIG